jgi:DNA-binding CsgD family transcriptional regulator/RecA/RadA recombinase
MGERDNGFTIVGRGSELAAIRKLIDALPRGGSLALTGEPGIGKTTLLDVAVARAEAAGARAVRLRADLATRTEHLGLLRPIVQASIGERLGIRQAVDAVLDLIESSRDPVLIVADDVQWADEPSLAALASIVRRATPHGLATIFASRTDVGSPSLVALFDAVVAVGGTDRVVPPLTASEVIRLVQLHTGTAPTSAVRARVARAGGNPFYALAVVDADVDVDSADLRDDTVDGEARYDQIERSLVRRARALGPSVFAVLQRAAVLGRSCRIDDLDALGGDRRQVISAVMAAGEAGLLHSEAAEVSFRHDIVAVAIERTIPAAARRELHRQAFEYLARLGETARLARHVLMLDLACVDPALSIEAARLASPAVAVEICDRLSGFGGLPDDWRDVAAGVRLTALLFSGRVDEAERIAAELLAAGCSLPLAADAHGVVMRARFLQGRSRTVVAEYGDDPLESAGVDVARYRAEMGLASLFAGDFARARRLARQAVEMPPSGEPIDRATAVVFAAMVHAYLAGCALDPDEVERQVAIAVAACRDVPDAGYAGPHLMAATVAIQLGQPVGALRSVEDDERATDFATATRPTFRHGLRALGHYQLGEWDHALAECEAGRAVAAESGVVANSGMIEGVAALIEMARGGAVAVDALLGAASLQGAGSDVAVAAAAQAMTLAGDPAGASGLWSMLLDLARRLDHRALAISHGPAAIRSMLAAGQRAAAAGWCEWFAQFDTGASEWAAIRVRWCAGLLAGTPAVLAEVASAYRRMELMTDAAAADGDAAVLAMPGAAGRAAGWYRGVGAFVLADRFVRPIEVQSVTAEALPPSRRRFGWESITGGERAVLALLAEGLANIEIAKRLYISRRTVESHLAHVYTKTGVGSRLMLATQAADRLRSGRL